MATELQQLLYAVLLAVAYLGVYAVVANVQLGTRYTAGPRDKPPEGLSTSAQRMGRAYANYLESLPWFAIAVIVSHLSEKADAVTITAGWVYLAARLVYLPAYVIEIPFVRSAVWSIATFAILTIVIRLLLV